MCLEKSLTPLISLKLELARSFLPKCVFFLLEVLILRLSWEQIGFHKTSREHEVR